MAAQRAAGVAFCATLKLQVRPSALRPVLPAAAALVAVMQTTSNAAAAISINSLITPPLRDHRKIAGLMADRSTGNTGSKTLKSARSLHKITAAQRASDASDGFRLPCKAGIIAHGHGPEGTPDFRREPCANQQTDHDGRIRIVIAKMNGRDWARCRNKRNTRH
jgi:hypothetical protein